MPGRHLNDIEQKLLRIWQDPPKELPHPMLRGISVEGGTGLRGITTLLISFNYPIVAICGKNGVGKSTVLALAALAHHSPSGWYVHRGNLRSRSESASRTYYVFSDFFFRTHGESSVDGVRITWRYLFRGREFELSGTRGSGDGWIKSQRRPERPTDYLPVSRVLPASEFTPLRTAFEGPVDGSQIEVLTPSFRKRLCTILDRQYEEADIERGKRHSLQRCKSGVPYTAFNMGAGESCAIELLATLQRMPRGGLVIIEEVELGLHPEAQVQLARILTEVAYEKHLQIICSTHSERFLDALPRQARILLRRTGDVHEIYEAPSTRFALQEMSGEVHPELFVFCEDRLAAIVIEEALPGRLRKRIQIIDVGSDTTVARQAVAHERMGSRIRALSVFDGDATPKRVEDWIKSEKGHRTDLNPLYLILPGEGLAPEQWITQELSFPDYLHALADALACTDTDARSYLQHIQVQPDHHNLGFALHQRTGLGVEDCTRRAVRAVAPRHPQLEPLRAQVEAMLDGKMVKA